MLNIRIINLSFGELRVIAQLRNISESKPKPKPEPELEPKVRVKTNQRKFKKLRKDFDELRHKFSIREIKEYRKAFYVAKNKKINIWMRTKEEK